MTNAELLALLREAKRLIAANRLMLGHYSGVREVGSLEDCIDAALAEEQPKIEREWAEDRKAHLKRVWWDAFHQASREGLDLSETERRADAAVDVEARRAATAAARGMR
jgi:hypothetical protein